MLKNMKVKKSLLLGYGVTIGISLLLLIFSLSRMINIRDNYETLLNEESDSNQYILYGSAPQ